MINASTTAHPAGTIGQSARRHPGDLISDEKTSIDPPSVSPRAKTGSAERTFNLSRFFGDTEIVEAAGESGEYTSFEEAKAAAINYLQEVIDLCEFRMEEVRDADTDDQYFGTDVGPSTQGAEGNIRYVCAGHYRPDPEIQQKPTPWFVGRLVKVRFPIPGRPLNGENTWVEVKDLRGDEFVGTLTNGPLYVDFHFGDEIVFRRDEILVVDGFGAGACGGSGLVAGTPEVSPAARRPGISPKR